MAFAYGTMQNFVLNVLEPHIRNVIDLLESSMNDLKKYLIDRMDDLEKRLTDFVNTSIAELRKEFDEFKVYVISFFDHRPEFPIGYISPYYGTLDSTNTHPLINDKVYTDWVVCDGRNGTPDLKDKFIIGANDNFGSRLGSKNHNHSISVSVGGSIRGTSLTTSQIPSHVHRFSDRHTGISGNPVDKWPGANNISVVSGVWETSGVATIAVATNYTFGDLTYHNTESAGSGSSHTHSHSLYGSGSSGNTSNIPPCMALHYIMYKKQTEV